LKKILFRIVYTHTQKSIKLHNAISVTCSLSWKSSNCINCSHRILRKPKKGHQQQLTHQNLQTVLIISGWREHSLRQKS